MTKLAFIIDIDTTIANNEHRAVLIQRECVACLSPVDSTHHRAECPVCSSLDTRVKQSSWDLFLDPDRLSRDTPVPKAQDAVYRMRELGMEFHFLTGRNERLREVTEAWLTEHFGWSADHSSKICMRGPEHRNTPASVYKEAALQQLIQSENMEGYTFIFMEDDPFVFRMYSKYGIVVKCPEGWDHWLPDAGSGKEPMLKR